MTFVKKLNNKYQKKGFIDGYKRAPHYLRFENFDPDLISIEGVFIKIQEEMGCSFDPQYQEFNCSEKQSEIVNQVTYSWLSGYAEGVEDFFK